jgi:solute carrier family 25 (mitochondrial phosphate transporter), member 3
MGADVFCYCEGTLTGFQWWIYDTFKSAMGLGTTGGK